MSHCHENIFSDEVARKALRLWENGQYVLPGWADDPIEAVPSCANQDKECRKGQEQ